MKELTLKAEKQSTAVVSALVCEELYRNGCGKKTKNQILLCVDELMSNIAKYAYKEDCGNVTVGIEIQEKRNEFVAVFKDNGIAFNPLEASEPETCADLESRKIGGLGIYLVKKSMDEVSYRRKDGQNILTIKKSLN